MKAGWGLAVYGQDRWKPQIAIGAQYKRDRDFDAVPAALGARRSRDGGLYASATKLFIEGPLGRSLLLNATLRGTCANQMGLLGFGSDRQDRMMIQVETSAQAILRSSWPIEPGRLMPGYPAQMPVSACPLAAQTPGRSASVWRSTWPRRPRV